ncbi:MAG: hypothetical protein H6837_12290 [Planctomycetes bacterium]|nr:hypothetical protein [Planctomycetota bacterium]
MFGSLRIRRSLLTPGDRDLYRAAFCAGCHALHATCGRSASLLTNYDQTVFALVLAGLTPGRAIERRPCTALPLRRVGVSLLDPRASALLAAANVGAVEAKLRDDLADGDRPLRSRVGLRLLRGPAARAREQLRALGVPTALFDELPARQAARERAARPTIEVLARPSAELVGQVFAHAGRVCGRPELADGLSELGRALGAFVYALDAWTDLTEDRARGRFNAWAATAPLGVDAGDVADHLDRTLVRASAAHRGLPLGDPGRVIAALLDSLGAKVAAVRRASTREPAVDRRQAGELACLTEAVCGEACCQACCEVTCCWSERSAMGRRRGGRRVAVVPRRRGRLRRKATNSPDSGTEGLGSFPRCFGSPE